MKSLRNEIYDQPDLQAFETVQNHRELLCLRIWLLYDNSSVNSNNSSVGTVPWQVRSEIIRENKMFELIGTSADHEYGYGGYTGNVTYDEVVVATFDTEKAARDYIEEAKLKKPKNYRMPFRTNSLLFYYEGAEVQERTIPEIPAIPAIPPHNPTIQERKVR